MRIVYFLFYFTDPFALVRELSAPKIMNFVTHKIVPLLITEWTIDMVFAENLILAYPQHGFFAVLAGQQSYKYTAKKSDKSEKNDDENHLSGEF